MVLFVHLKGDIKALCSPVVIINYTSASAIPVAPYPKARNILDYGERLDSLLFLIDPSNTHILCLYAIEINRRTLYSESETVLDGT